MTTNNHQVQETRECDSSKSRPDGYVKSAAQDVEDLNNFSIPCKNVRPSCKQTAATEVASTTWIDPREFTDVAYVSQLDTGPSRFPDDFPDRVNALKNLYVDCLLTQQECFKQIRRLEAQFNTNEQRQLDAENSDIPVLDFLVDVRQSDIFDKLDPKGFRLEFEFADNPYFTNKILTKTVYFQYGYETKQNLINAPTNGLQVSHVEGCGIDWKNTQFEGITQDRMQQPVPRCRTLAALKKVPVQYRKKPSFFHFFQTDDTAKQVDIRLGFYFKEYILPEKTMIYAGNTTGAVTTSII